MWFIMQGFFGDIFLFFFKLSWFTYGWVFGMVSFPGCEFRFCYVLLWFLLIEVRAFTINWFFVFVEDAERYQFILESFLVNFGTGVVLATQALADYAPFTMVTFILLFFSIVLSLLFALDFSSTGVESIAFLIPIAIDD